MNKQVPESARMQAQNLAYQAMDERNPEEMLRLCKQALDIDPRCVDALTLLSGLIQDDDERIDKLINVISMAEEDLGGKSYFEENEGYFWGMLETRPYMRTGQFLAQTLQDAGKIEEAISVYETLLRLNPNDNQGVRYTLIGLYLETHHVDGVHQILDRYGDEKSAIFTWSAILDNIISDDIASASLKLIEARKRNPYVESYLLGKTPIPMQAPEIYRVGDRNEAIICAMTIGNAWQKNSVAMQWLRMNESVMPALDKNKTGRNDPCPCGSGKKYKKCCLGREDAPASGVGSPMTGEIVLNDIQRELEGKSFTSQEEANDFIQEYNQKRNSTPIDDFEGLSSAQMHRLINFPLDSPEVVEFPSVLDTVPSAPSVKLFGLLADAVGENGLKPTAKGNLPLKVVRNIALADMGEDEYAKYTEYGSIRSEEEYHELHATRIIAGLAGLIHIYKGKFILSTKCRKLLKTNGMSGIYPILLRTCAEKFNWGYLDGYPESEFIQSFFTFPLYLLARYGDQWRDNKFYEDVFLRAFPSAVDTVPPISYRTQEEIIRGMFSLRCLERFAEYMGLVEIERNPGDRYNGVFRVRKTPLLDDAVRFHI